VIIKADDLESSRSGKAYDLFDAVFPVAEGGPDIKQARHSQVIPMVEGECFSRKKKQDRKQEG
jgi:hypothetical protein